jgi:alanyl-tRNA synthetase
MGASFPELLHAPQKVKQSIVDEERTFLRTLERGIALFQKARAIAGRRFRVATAVRPGAPAKLVEPATAEELAHIEKYRDVEQPVISDEVAFQLHDTFGLYIDIVEQMAAETGAVVDRSGFNNLMEAAKARSRGAKKSLAIEAIQGDLPKTDDSPKYGPLTLTAKIVGWVKDNTVFREGSLSATDTVSLLLDRTNFYAEQGGQVGDIGHIRADGMDFIVEDTQRLGDSVLHSGVLTEGTVKVGQTVTAAVTDRMFTVRNHTATHLLNLALREVLGSHIEQKGSLVDAEKTRFDFSHDKPLTPDEIRQVEEIVNAQILRDQPVTAMTMPLADAKKIPGVRAVFGEKYPDPVRVILIGAEKPSDATAQMSVEFCGGTHLSRTSQAGLFKIVSQENVAKGVRRVTAVTGQRAFDYVQEIADVLGKLTSRFNCSVEELPKRVDSLQEEAKKLQKQLQKGAAGDLNSAADQLLAKATEIKGAKLVVGEVPGAPVDAMRGQIDRLRQKAGSSLIVLGWKNEDGTPGLAVGVSEDLTKKGIKSNDVIKPVAEIIGGKGGGPPHLATAGGKDASKLPDALAKAVELGTALLNR